MVHRNRPFDLRRLAAPILSMATAVFLAWTADGLAASQAANDGAGRLPPPESNLRLAAPIATWDEAIPLGNGHLGGLLWGGGSTVRLSLDRGDLWDERPADGVQWSEFNYATMVRLVREGKNDALNRIFDHPYGDLHPTKIPAGRLELDLDGARKVQSFELDLASATGRARLDDGSAIEVFFCASRPAALLRVSGASPRALRLQAPESLKALGYPEPKAGEDGSARWFLQEAADGLRFCVLAAWERTAGGTVIALTAASTRDGADPLAIARERAASALAADWDPLEKAHRAWWSGFWSRSAVRIPEADILRHYHLVQYFHGAASRRGAPPMPLQGVWTADEGGLPPWKGDYHNDLNTQMTYIAYQTAGRFDEGLSFLDYLWDLLPVFRKFARDFYGAPGAAVPGVMSLAGQALGGWGHYSLSPVMGAWNGHLFYLHWRYTADAAFLRERAYPWCREIGECLLHLLKPDAKGLLKLPLSTSPEIHDNSARAWLEPNTNYDLACLKMLFSALAEMAAAAGDRDDAARWAKAAGDLGAFHTDPGGVLRLSAAEDLRESHRHLSNIIAIHPFNLLTVDGGAQERRIIQSSVKHWDGLGTMAWCGYSFSWMSCLRARAGDAAAALRNLDIFVKAFILRNGFHANGDQTRTGLSGFTYRPFTLEGNFLAAQAVQEMLLQSWSARAGSGDWGPIRIFPAMPWRWHEASFEDLRAEGGHRVSARRERNATVWFRVTAGRDGTVKIRDNFGGRPLQWSRSGIRKSGEDFEVDLKAGDFVEAEIQAPDRIPDPPPDAAEPVLIRPPQAIRANTLPLRIGADSNGENRFDGDIARASVFDRALTAAEIGRLADKASGRLEALPGCVATLDFGQLRNGSLPCAGSGRLSARAVGEVSLVDAGEGLSAKALRLDGRGFLEIPHDKALDCLGGVTLEAWIRPQRLPPAGARILDKSPVGVATAYLLDTYPGDSLRLITRDPHLIHGAKLPLGAWTHVAATCDTATGRQALYIDGHLAATSP